MTFNYLKFYTCLVYHSTSTVFTIKFQLWGWVMCLCLRDSPFRWWIVGFFTNAINIRNTDLDLKSRIRKFFIGIVLKLRPHPHEPSTIWTKIKHNYTRFPFSSFSSNNISAILRVSDRSIILTQNHCIWYNYDLSFYEPSYFILHLYLFALDSRLYLFWH